MNINTMKLALFLYYFPMIAACGALGLPDSAIGFQVRGTLTHHFPRFQGADATEVFKFELVVKGGEWSIEQNQVKGQRFRASGVGNSIFALPSFSEYASITNGTAAEIYSGGYPYDLPSSITIPWFVYASNEYLKTNGFRVLGLPVYQAVYEPFGVYFWSQASVSLDPPFLPSKATFTPGNPVWNDVLRHTDGIIRNASYSRFVDDLDRTRMYASIPTNFVACDYEVLSWETFQGLSLPKTFSFEVFMPGDKKTIVEPFGSWIGEATSFHSLPKDQEPRLLPKIPNNSRLFVLDRRLQDQRDKIDGINYVVTNEWPLKLPDFASAFLEAKRESLRKGSAEPTSAVQKGPGVVIVTIFLTSLIIVFLNGVRKR
jgi:hypothetical protein